MGAKIDLFTYISTLLKKYLLEVTPTQSIFRIHYQRLLKIQIYALLYFL